MNVEQRSNWTNPSIKYLKNVIITEYDLRSGGLSVIKEFNLLTESEIEKLDSMEKKTKNIMIGKMQVRDIDLGSKMVSGFGKARRMFVEQNGIPDDNILSIKKDAFFLINCNGIDEKVSENLEFRKKNTYTSYLNVNRKEFFYDPGNETLDVKGISDLSREFQKDYLLKDIKKFLKQGERLTKEMIYNNLLRYRSDYLNMRLPIQTYRNLDTGMFDLKTLNFTVEELQKDMEYDLDITFNYIKYILPLIQCLMK